MVIFAEIYKKGTLPYVDVEMVVKKISYRNKISTRAYRNGLCSMRRGDATVSAGR